MASLPPLCKLLLIYFLHGAGEQLGVGWCSQVWGKGAKDSGATTETGKEGKRREILQKMNENANVQHSIIPRDQKVETQVSIRWMNKQNPYNGISI